MKRLIIAVCMLLPLISLSQSSKTYKGYELVSVITACPVYRTMIGEAIFKRTKINIRKQGFNCFLGVYRIEGTKNLCFVYGRIKK